MSAMVLDFQRAVRRRNGVVAQRNAGLGVDDAITQAVMDTFAIYPIDIIAAGIQSARDSLAAGSGFMQCMDAAAHTIAILAPAVDINAAIEASGHVSLDQLLERRDRRTTALLEISERMIRSYLKDRPEDEIAMAIARANRVLMGGGSLCNSIYHATSVYVRA